MYAILGYFNSANNQAAGVVSDTPAIVDGNFSIRNNHFIFTEQYSLVATAALGATLTAAQLDSPTIDAFNPMQIYPTIASGIVPPTNPNVMDLRMNPIPIPLNEELQLKLAGGAGGAEPDYGIIWLRASGPGAVDYVVPTPTLTNPRFFALFTATLVLTAGVWSPFGGITFTNPLRGGAYQCNGAFLVCAHAVAYRINFVKSPMYAGRKLYPGGLVENAYGNQILRFGDAWLGGQGRFNNFELPQMAVLGSTTETSATYTGYMDLSYLGATGPDALP